GIQISCSQLAIALSIISCNGLCNPSGNSMPVCGQNGGRRELSPIACGRCIAAKIAITAGPSSTVPDWVDTTCGQLFATHCRRATCRNDNTGHQGAIMNIPEI